MNFEVSWKSGPIDFEIHGQHFGILDITHSLHHVSEESATETKRNEINGVVGHDVAL